MSEPLHITQATLNVGGLALRDVEVIGERAVGDTVLRGSRLRITGKWSADAPFDMLRDQWATTPPERGGQVEARLTPGNDGDELHVGPVWLREWLIVIGSAIAPDGIVVRGSAVEIEGVMARAVSFVGWDAVPAASQRKVVKRIERDEHGQITAVIEETVE